MRLDNHVVVTVVHGDHLSRFAFAEHKTVQQCALEVAYSFELLRGSDLRDRRVWGLKRWGEPLAQELRASHLLEREEYRLYSLDSTEDGGT